MLKNKLKKSDIVRNLSIKSGFPSTLSKKLVNDLINILNQNIKAGRLILKNVGTFKILRKKERVGRNPKTKEFFIIAPRKSISFKLSKNISKKLTQLI